MRSASKLTLLTTAVMCGVLGSMYWYFRILPIQRAERTPLDEIFANKRRFIDIKWNQSAARDQAILQGYAPSQAVDCNDPMYDQAGGTLEASKAYNNWVQKTRSAERAAIVFHEKQQEELAAKAEADAVARFETAQKLRTQIECYEIAKQQEKPSY